MSDITTTTVTADGVAVNHPARVKSIYYIRGASAGSIVLKDGGASGTTLLTLTTPGAGSGVDAANTWQFPATDCVSLQMFTLMLPTYHL